MQNCFLSFYPMLDDVLHPANVNDSEDSLDVDATKMEIWVEDVAVKLEDLEGKGSRRALVEARRKGNCVVLITKGGGKHRRRE